MRWALALLLLCGCVVEHKFVVHDHYGVKELPSGGTVVIRKRVKEKWVVWERSAKVRVETVEEFDLEWGEGGHGLEELGLQGKMESDLDM